MRDNYTLTPRTMMDQILQQFVLSSREQKNLIQAVNEIDRRYCRDGLTKEDIPGVLGILISQAQSLKKMKGADRKKLVIDILYHLIEKIDGGAEDSEFETMLKTMVPPMIDGMAALIKFKNKCMPCLAK